MDGDDRAVLSVHGLDLQPGVGAFALRVGSVEVLDHRTLETLRDEAAESIVGVDAHEGLDQADGVGELKLDHLCAALAVGSDIVGQVEQPEERILGGLAGSDIADRVVEVSAGDGFAVKGVDAVLASDVSEPRTEVLDGRERVAVARLHGHGQRLSADFHDHADAVNLRLDRVGLGEDALVGLGQHGRGERGGGRLASADTEVRLAFNHVEDESVEVGVGIGG